MELRSGGIESSVGMSCYYLRCDGYVSRPEEKPAGYCQNWGKPWGTWDLYIHTKYVCMYILFVQLFASVCLYSPHFASIRSYLPLFASVCLSVPLPASSKSFTTESIKPTAVVGLRSPHSGTSNLQGSRPAIISELCIYPTGRWIDCSNESPQCPP